MSKMARAAQSEEGKAGFLLHRDETQRRSSALRRSLNCLVSWPAERFARQSRGS